MRFAVEPFLLNPIFECRSGEGQRLQKFWNLVSEEEGTSAQGCDTVWLVADTPERQTTVRDGDYAGCSLRRLMEERGKEIVGGGFDSEEGFPLTLRLMDTVKPTPLEVQPLTPGLPTANSKFWYLLDTGPDQGGIGAGIRRRATRMQVMQHLNDESLQDLIESLPAKPGDSFLLPPGVVHYLGANILALELQDGRISPHVVSHWGTKETDAEAQREALEAVQFENRNCWRVAGDSADFPYTRKIPLVKQCPEFIVDEFRLKDYSAERTSELSFHLFCGLKGRFDLKSRKGYHARIGPGQVVCVPANYGDYFLSAPEGAARFLRIYLMTESEPGVRERSGNSR